MFSGCVEFSFFQLVSHCSITLWSDLVIHGIMNLTKQYFSTVWREIQLEIWEEYWLISGSLLSAGLDTQSSCPGPRPAGDFQKCPSGGRREEKERRKFPSALPLVLNSLAPSTRWKRPCFSERSMDLLSHLSGNVWFVPLCTSSAALPCLHGGAGFGLPSPAPG